MQLTQQIKIDVNPDKKDVLWKLSEKCRLIYNFALDERKKAFDAGKKVVMLTNKTLCQRSKNSSLNMVGV